MRNLMNDDAAARRRRWLMPLVVLCVAGAIAIWGSSREAGKIQQVESAVRALCRDVATGRDVAEYFDATSDALRQRVVNVLRLACPTPEMADVMEVVVRPGEASGSTQMQGNASHTATIRANNVELITLRVRHLGDGRMHVVGYSIPQMSSARR